MRAQSTSGSTRPNLIDVQRASSGSKPKVARDPYAVTGTRPVDWQRLDFEGIKKHLLEGTVRVEFNPPGADHALVDAMKPKGKNNPVVTVPAPLKFKHALHGGTYRITKGFHQESDPHITIEGGAQGTMHAYVKDPAHGPWDVRVTLSNAERDGSILRLTQRQ